MKVFLVEDDEILNEAVSVSLESLGFEVCKFYDGQTAFDNITNQYKIFLVDINLPNINGFELVKRIKKFNPKAVVFIMSADINIDTIVKAYDIGCDDYLKKPFDIRELLAKINKAMNDTDDIVKVEQNCYYDIKKESLIYKGVIIKLTKKEKALLHILVMNIGETVNNDQIELYVWEEELGNGYVRQLVAKLRKKLPCDIIVNHAGNGYRIEKYKRK
jgi:DNA-binding response OmpR family regulator